jgi:hypothetical protein
MKKQVKKLPPITDKPLRCALRLLQMYEAGNTYISADKRMLLAYQRTLESHEFPVPEGPVEAKILYEAMVLKGIEKRGYTL